MYRACAYYKVDGLEDGMDEYFCIKRDDEREADNEAIRRAKEWASNGVDFQDIWQVSLDLVEVSEVDGEQECFPEIRQVWY